MNTYLATKNMMEIRMIKARMPIFSHGDSFSIIRNIGYALGISSNNNNYFDKEINKLVSKALIEKVYDVTDENGFREGLYRFPHDESSHFHFHGTGINRRLFYCY